MQEMRDEMKGRDKQIREELRWRVITTQKVLLYTFNTLFFEHFLCSNWPNWPNWHINFLTSLLISVCGKFCCFWRLYIFKIGIQLKGMKNPIVV